MPLYIYKATDINKVVNTGSISASSDIEVASMLQKRDLDPISIKEKKVSSKSKGVLPIVEKITFCRYMSTMLNAGLSLSEGITVLKKEASNPLMAQILDDILYHLERGQSLSVVFQLYPQTFDNFFITLVKAGEVSGTLADSFKYLEEEMKAEYSLIQNIKSALTYPAIVIAAMILIGFLMLFFVMPQLGKVFLAMTIPLPAVTKALFSFTVQMAVYRYPIMGGIVLGVILLLVFIRMPFGKRVVFKLISPVPVVKNLMKQLDMARFCRIFSTLTSSAVPITEALEIGLNSLSYPPYRSKAGPIPEEINRGKTLAASFSQHNVFPPLLTQMIAAGEKSGTLDQTLGDLAEFYEGEVEESVKKATQMLEPLLMLIVGVGVGAMILSIIAPLYSIVGNLQQAA